MEFQPGKFYAYTNSPIGHLLIISNGETIEQCRFDEPMAGITPNPDKLTAACEKQLQEYFAGTRKIFELPLSLSGTPYQYAIWNMLVEIPYGTTRSYSELAIQSANAYGSRAVGHAVGQNPLLVLIPCHRVLSSNGKLTGYAGGKERKRWLLQHELTHSSASDRLF